MPTVTVAPSMPFPVVASTTVSLTARASLKSIVFGSAFPSLSTVTGTVTTVSLPSICASTVTVPSVGAGTSLTVAAPSGPVVALCSAPSPSTIVTAASFTGSGPFVTVIVTSFTTRASSILSGVAAPSASTDTSAPPAV